MATCLIYVETNSLMAVATGREPLGDQLLSITIPTCRIAIPSVCYMEAFSVLEDERKRRNSFKNQCEQQIAQVRRDTTSPHAKSLLTHLEEARLMNQRLLNDVQGRLFQYVERASACFENIEVSPQVLRASLNNLVIADPTDNLILHIILDHANRTPCDEKALLTGNYTDFDAPDVRSALQAVGITKYFQNVDNLLGWLRSLPI